MDLPGQKRKMEATSDAAEPWVWAGAELQKQYPAMLYRIEPAWRQVLGHPDVAAFEEWDRQVRPTPDPQKFFKASHFCRVIDTVGRLHETTRPNSYDQMTTNLQDLFTPSPKPVEWARLWLRCQDAAAAVVRYDDAGPCPFKLVEQLVMDVLTGFQCGDTRIPLSNSWHSSYTYHLPHVCVLEHHKNDYKLCQEEDAKNVQRGQELTRNGLLLELLQLLLPVPILRLTLETPEEHADEAQGRPTLYFAQADFATLSKSLRP